MVVEIVRFAFGVLGAFAGYQTIACLPRGDRLAMAGGVVEAQVTSVLQNPAGTMIVAKVVRA